VFRSLTRLENVLFIYILCKQSELSKCSEVKGIKKGIKLEDVELIGKVGKCYFYFYLYLFIFIYIY
jgi:hypothetical protein